MSNDYRTKDTEQYILNDAKDDTYGTLDVTPYVETTPGSVAARVSGSTRGGKTVASVEIVDAAGDQITTFGAAGGATETTLAAIKNTDGIKKITDTVTVQGDLGVNNTAGDPINPATEDQQTLLRADANLDGTGVAGTLALASANTWYACPTTVPTAPYVLVVSLENAAGTIRWTLSTSGGAPSATSGNLAPGHLTIRLAANEFIRYGSSTAGDDVNWLTKEIT